MKENKPAEEERRFKSNSKYFTICVYVAVTFAICAVIALVVFNFSSAWSGLKSVFSVLTPFLLGVILAYLVNPLYNVLDNVVFAKWLSMRSLRKTRKALAIVIAYIVVFGIIALLVVFVIPQLGQSIQALVNTITEFMPTVQNWLSELQAKFSEVEFADTINLSEAIDSLMSTIISYLQNYAGSIVSSLLSTSISVVSGVVKFLMAIFVSIYIIADKQHLEGSIRNTVYAVFRHDTAVKICRRARESSTIFSNFFAGKVIDSLIIGLLTFVMMNIFGLPYSLLISSIVAVTNMIPDFGPVIGAIPGILILLMVGFREGLTFGILILIIQQLDGRVFGPHILGDSAGLWPIWILFAITIGAKVAGVIGMFVAVPIVAIIVYLIEDSVNERLKKKGLDSMATEREAPTSWSISSLFKRSGKTGKIRKKFVRNKKQDEDVSGENADKAEDPENTEK